jgi:hypothetical protein
VADAALEGPLFHFWVAADLAARLEAALFPNENGGGGGRLPWRLLSPARCWTADAALEGPLFHSIVAADLAPRLEAALFPNENGGGGGRVP